MTPASPLHFGATRLLVAGLLVQTLSCGNSSEPGPIIGAGTGGTSTAGATGTGGSVVLPPDSMQRPNIIDLGEGTGGSDLSTDFDSDQGCATEEANTQPSPAFVEFLVDTSLSMAQSAQGGNQQPSKWVQTRDVLVGAIAEMSDDTAVGLAFYPDVGVGSNPCFDEEQDVALSLLGKSGSEQRDKLIQAFAAQEPDGSTPTHDAYIYSVSELAKIDSSNARFVVLITDGEPTYSLGCQGSGQPGDGVETGPLIKEAKDAFDDQEIRTFVIGSPGSEVARSSLSQMAEAGGTALAGCSHDGPNYCHFDMTQEADFAQALGNALLAISGQTLSCTYDIPTPPSGNALDRQKVNVLFTPTATGDANNAADVAPEDLLRASSEACETGWQYSQDDSQIVLCPDTCERIAATAGQLTLVFGCKTNDDLF